MGRFICLHTSDNSNREVWINTDAIAAVIEKRPLRNLTRIDTYTGSGGYCVKETAESVIGLIKQQISPLDNYVCPVPETVNLVKVRDEEEEKRNGQN